MKFTTRTRSYGDQCDAPRTRLNERARAKVQLERLEPVARRSTFRVPVSAFHLPVSVAAFLLQRSQLRLERVRDVPLRLVLAFVVSLVSSRGRDERLVGFVHASDDVADRVLLFALVARHDDAGGAVRDRGVGDDLEGARMEGGGRYKVLKDRRSPRERGRMGTSVRCDGGLRGIERSSGEIDERIVVAEIGADDGRRRREGLPKRRRT